MKKRKPWWNIKESNLEPPGYEPDALTSCANVPYVRVAYKTYWRRKHNYSIRQKCFFERSATYNSL